MRWSEVRSVEGTHPMIVQMARDGRIVNLDEHREDQRLGGRPPEWLLDDRRAWLIVPLIHLERLAGFLLLERSPVSSEEHTSEPQSLMRTSYAAFCLKKTK